MAHKNKKMKMGWLEKQSKHLRLFRRRWIEAYPQDKLCSYSKSSSASPTEIIDLSGVHKAYKSNINFNEFIIAYFEDGDIKSRRFRADTIEQVNEWIDFFNQTCNDDNHSCTRCDKVDEQIMSKLHITDHGTDVNNHDTNNNNTTSRINAGSSIERASKLRQSSQSISIPTLKNDGSLEDFIDEIAFDITQNHQYLKVVLECNKDKKRLSIINI